MIILSQLINGDTNYWDTERQDYKCEFKFINQINFVYFTSKKKIEFNDLL